MIARVLACFVALCLVGGAIQAGDLATVDASAELELAPLDMQIPAPIVTVVPIRHPMACELPPISALLSRLHVTDAFRPPQP